MRTKIHTATTSKGEGAAQDAALRKVVEWCRRKIEANDTPVKVGVMRRCAEIAWDAVHILTASGAKFPGTPNQAALVIAGTAYCAWREAYEPCPEHEEHQAETAIALGLVDGIEYATLNATDVLPAKYLWCFERVAVGNLDLMDSVPPMQLMAALWPDDFTAREIRLPVPQYRAPGDTRMDFEAEACEASANPFTTPIEAVMADDRRACREFSRKKKLQAVKAKRRKPR